jgi:hypothetical protein
MVPSDAESQEIRKSIALVQGNISQLDTDVACAQRHWWHGHAVERLIEERKALNEYASVHAAPQRGGFHLKFGQSVSRCLSMATRGIVIFRTLDLALEVHLKFSFRYAACNDWKSIALSFPRLWSSIPIDHLISWGRVPPSVIQTYLRRSQSAPLSVILQQDRIIGSAAYSVLQQSHRWRLASLTLPVYFLGPFSQLKDNLPELEELHIKFECVVRTYSVPQQYIEQIDIFLNAPKLRRVKIHDLLTSSIVNIKLPWAHLSSNNSYRHSNMTSFYFLLHSAPRMLEVEWCLAYPAQTTPWPTVQHSGLRKLSLCIRANPGSALDNLSLPSLRMLSIDSQGRQLNLSYRGFVHL